MGNRVGGVRWKWCWRVEGSWTPCSPFTNSRLAAGVKANYKGTIVGEEYTRWPDQLDFSAELSKARAAKPEAIFAFYPGGAGIQFMTQYMQAGLKQQIPLYTAFIVDALSLPRLKENALGIPGAQHWVADLQNEANKKFRRGLSGKVQAHAVVLRGAGL